MCSPLRKQGARRWAAYEEYLGRPCPPGFQRGIRIYDLKHTFGRRLRAAGVGPGTRKALLGHKNGDITTRNSAAEIGALLEAAERVVNQSRTGATLLRVAS